MLNRHYKIKNTVIVTLIALLFLSWVIFRIFFPVFHFSYNGQTKNDNFFIREINQKIYLQLKLRGGYSFNKILLKIKPGKENIVLGNVYQDELMLYAQGQSINSLEKLKKYLIIDSPKVYNGQLISHGDSVFFIENGKYRTFADAETFDSLGFNWQRVIKVDNKILHDLKKGEDITHTTIYLNDLFVKINNELYFLNDNKRVLIKNAQVKKFIENNFSVINVDKKKLDSALVGKMICQKAFFGGKCFLKRNKAVVFPRAEILMEVKNKDIFKNNKILVRVDTFDGIHSIVPKITIKNIKRLINVRYEDEMIKLKDVLK